MMNVCNRFSISRIESSIKPVNIKVTSTESFSKINTRFHNKSQNHSKKYKYNLNAYRNETSQEALERRLKESKQVEERVIFLNDTQDFEKEVKEENDLLVVLEASSIEMCDSGITESPEIQWKYERLEEEKALKQECDKIKHSFQRTARECPDVKFVAIDADTEEGMKICEMLNIDTIPTLQFFKNGKMLWEHKGALYLQQDLGEGVLYYGDTYGGGAKASQFITEIHSEEDLEKYKNETKEEPISILDISSSAAVPCIRIYPAVLAFARNFKGCVSFARLICDESEECQKMTKDMNIVEVPTFIFYKNGKEIHRHVGSSRGDLIGQLLTQLEKHNIKPPPPPPPPSASSQTGINVDIKSKISTNIN